MTVELERSISDEIDPSRQEDIDSWVVSVIVPAFNAASTLKACLAALNNQTYPHDLYEVIVVDDGSTDTTASIAQDAGARLIHKKNQGPAAARNSGVEAATGDFVLFTDADCAPAPDWIEKMIEAFCDPNVVGAKGVYRTSQKELMARFVQCEYEDKYDRLINQTQIDFIDTYSAAYRRSRFLENGGFDPIFPRPSVEDQEFSFRLAEKGYRLVFVPNAIVYHRHDRTLSEYARRKYNIGYWKALLIRWHPDKIAHDSHTPQIIKIQIMLLGLIGLALASWSIRPSLGKVSIIALVMLFGLSAVPFTIKLLRQDKALLTIILPALVVRAAALGAGLATGFIHFMARPVKTRPIFSLYNRIAKRLMDIVGALIGLVFSTPLMAALAVLIKLDSPGPIFFSQVRVGENGRPFRIIKLRSMVQNAEDLLPQLVDLEKLESPAFKIEGDPRVTHIGRFLRRTSLDELPQFWNVLVGNMSLVGPRPEEVALVQKYNDWHRKRLAVKPGMTGPMQVNGRGDLSLDERVRLELEYIDNYSIWSDLVFLIRTLPAVFFCRGAR
jgi:lipopolysaccharide/colanic/teichoic acid biosynthesis glycosyltransferase/glycosyltransferase involved in cell wall biosynthesis